MHRLLSIFVLLTMGLRAFGAGPLETNTFTYNSSIDSNATNLVGMVIWDRSTTNAATVTNKAPILVYAHPYSNEANSPGDNTNCWSGNTTNMLMSMASNGWMVVALGMRGRYGALGTNDDSGKELHDIYDGIRYVKTNDTWREKHNNYVALMGISGGGGNAMGYMSKFPDSVNFAVSYFGISDYGYDATYGWYQQPGPTAMLGFTMNGTPGTAPDNYRARNAVESAPTTVVSNSYLYLYHNNSDTTVAYSQSWRMNNAFSNAANNRVSFSNHATLYQHNLPTAAPFLPDMFDQWAANITNRAFPEWSLAPTGSMRVIGYNVNNLFSIWLGGGTNEVADLVYNALTGSYTVTNLTGSMDVRIYQSGLSKTQTVSSATTIDMGFLVAAPSDFRTDAADFNNVAAGYIQAQFRWTDNANNETAYYVEVSTNGVDFFSYATIAANATSYDSAIVPWTSNRWWRVRCGLGTSYSPYTAPIRVVGNMPCTRLEVASPATNRVTVSWDTAGGILDGYTVEQDTNSFFNSSAKQTYFATGISTDTLEITNQFELNKTYYFRVRSHSSGGDAEAQNKPISYVAVAPNGPPTAVNFIAQYQNASAAETLILFDDTSVNETAWALWWTTNAWTTSNAISVARDSGITRYSVTHSSMSANTTYSYRLFGTNTLGLGAPLQWQFRTPNNVSGSWDVWYVDDGATAGNHTGTNWANAWQDIGAINWTQIGAGDVIYVAGGNYTNFFVAYADGTYGSRITIKSATNAPYNDRIYQYGAIYWRASYVTVDGSLSPAITNLAADNIAQNINWEVIGRADITDPLMRPIVATGAVAKWIELWGVGSPLSGENDAIGLDAQPVSGLATNCEFAYLWIHDTFGHLVNQGKGDGAGVMPQGSVLIHHCLGEDGHNNFFAVQMGVDIYDNLFRDFQGPGVAHPDCIQGGFQNVRMWNNRFYRFVGQAFYPDFNGSMTNMVMVNNVFAADTVDSQAVPQVDNLWLVDFLIAGNTFYGSNVNTFSFSGNPKTNLNLKNIRMENNLFYSGTNASTGAAQFSSGPWWYAEADLVFNYNVICGPSKKLYYRTNQVDLSAVNLFDTGEQMSTWSTNWKSNRSDQVQLMREYVYNFPLYGGDTSAMNRGRDLSSLSSTLSAITNDLTGAVRGQGTGWDIGAYEHDPSLIVYIDFENFTNAAGAWFEDRSGHTNAGYAVTNVTQSGVNNSNFSPIRIVGRVGNYAAAFSDLGTNEQWLTHAQNFGYTIGTWFGITNLDGMTPLTNGTWAAWIAWTNSAGIGDSTLFDGSDTGGTVDTWRISAYDIQQQAFTIISNGAHRTKVAAPVQPTNQWVHLAYTWSGTNGQSSSGTVFGYTNGVQFSSNSLNTTSVKVFPDSHVVMVGGMLFGYDYKIGSGHPNNGWFTGWMDELRLYNRQLSASEVYGLYGGGSTGGSAAQGGGGGGETPGPPFHRGIRAGRFRR